MKIIISLITLLFSINTFAQHFCATNDADFEHIERKALNSKSLKAAEDTNYVSVYFYLIAANQSSIPLDINQQKVDQIIEDLNAEFNELGIGFQNCDDLQIILNEDYPAQDVVAYDDGLRAHYQVNGSVSVFIAPNVFNGSSAVAIRTKEYIASTYLGFDTKTMIHEFGHIFSLPHTHSTDELVDGSNCITAGDKFCDTPADPNLLGLVDEDCKMTVEKTDANGDVYAPLLNNHMSYSRNTCRSSFTPEQIQAMQSTFEEKIVSKKYLQCDYDTSFGIVQSAPFSSDCVGFLSDGSGHLNYASNTSSSYLLETPNTSDKLTISFDLFETELNGDILKIYDGEDNTAPLLLEHSGSTLPNQFQASSNKVFIEFSTNNSEEYNGWVLRYSCFNGPDLEAILPYGNFYEINEDKLIVKIGITNHGTIASQVVQSSLRIYDVAFTFTGADTSLFFDTPVVEPFDTVQVEVEFDICIFEARNESRGSYKFELFLDWFNVMQERSRANNYEKQSSIGDDPICTTCSDKSGFNLQRDSLEDGSGKNQRYEANLSCNWLIEVEQGNLIHAYFDYVDIAPYNSFSKTGDSLLIYDGADNSSELLAVIKGYEFKDTLISSTNSLFLEFISDSIGTGLGWKMQYFTSGTSALKENENLEILVYPNPSSNGEFFLKDNLTSELQLYQADGRLIADLEEGVKSFKVPKPGVYILKSRYGFYQRLLSY